MKRVTKKGKRYTYFGLAFRNPESTKREMLGIFTPRLVIPQDMDIKRLKAESSVDVIYRKRKGFGYNIYVKGKKKRIPLFHPIIMEKP
jgi:hypothetical protein